MRGRLKLILPGVNLATAAALLGVAYARPMTEGTSPTPWEMVLCFSINAPANLVRYLVSFLWDRHVYPYCPAASAETCIRIGRGIDLVVFLLGVAFFWYVVALEIEAISRGTSAMARLSTPTRVVVDASLVAAGSLFLFLAVENWRSFHPINPWYGAAIFCSLA